MEKDKTHCEHILCTNKRALKQERIGRRQAVCPMMTMISIQIVYECIHALHAA
jgi:hypothetical protein